jgi:hypothetical protein
MEIADSRAGFYFGLAIEAFLACAVTFLLVVGAPGNLVGLMLFAALGWGGLIVLWLAFSVRLHADERGLRGRIGLAQVDLAWSEVADVKLLLGRLKLRLADGREWNLQLPNLAPDEAIEKIWTLMGKTVRVLERPREQYAIPRGVETYLALERSATELRCVNVMVGGPDAEDVARAARTLLVRAADENRWDPSFSGRIKVLVSALRTPISPALDALMSRALDGARQDLAARGWTVSGGASFTLSWQVMGRT